MKLKEYAKRINELRNQYGGDLDVIYGTDDEGNNFDEVFYRPSVGVRDKNGMFIGKKDNPNCICIN